MERMSLKQQKNNSTTNKKQQLRPIQAYIMTTMYPGTYTKAIDEIRKLNYIERISVVSGDSELIVKVNVKNLGQLHKITSQLQRVVGVEKTNTRIIEKECRSFSK